MPHLSTGNSLDAPSYKVSPIQVAYVYLMIGTIGFGGGYAVLNLIHNELVEKRKWVSEERYQNMLALSQMAPGALTVNLLASISYRLGGIRSMLLGIGALILPSFLIVLLLSGLFLAFQSNSLVMGAMQGLATGVVGLMLAVVWDLSKRFADWFPYFVALLTLILGLSLKVNPILLVLLGALAGVLKSIAIPLYQGFKAGKMKGTKEP